MVYVVGGIVGLLQDGRRSQVGPRHDAVAVVLGVAQLRAFKDGLFQLCIRNIADGKGGADAEREGVPATEGRTERGGRRARETWARNLAQPGARAGQGDATRTILVDACQQHDAKHHNADPDPLQWSRTFQFENE